METFERTWKFMIIIRIIIYVLNVVPGKRLTQSPDNKREYGTSENPY